ncbi:MAG: thioredoxin [Porphyromonas sp.]|nr:thioredoxin [Porphyromonas sp.]
MAFEFTDSNFKAELQSGKAMVVDFWASWCGPCRMVGPIIEELAQKYEGKVLVGKLNVDENSDIPVEYSVRNIPTILFIKDGEVKQRVVGVQSKGSLEAEIEKLL